MRLIVTVLSVGHRDPFRLRAIGSFVLLPAAYSAEVLIEGQSGRRDALNRHTERFLVLPVNDAGAAGRELREYNLR